MWEKFESNLPVCIVGQILTQFLAKIELNQGGCREESQTRCGEQKGRMFRQSC